VRVAALERDRARRAVVEILQADLDRGLERLPGARTARVPGSAAPRGATVGLSAQVPEERLEERAEAAVAELELAAPLAAGVEPELLPAGRRRELLAVLPARAESVVALALLRILEHLVRLRDLREALRRALALVDVGVVLARELAVGLADLLLARVAGDPQGRVVVVELDAQGRRSVRSPII
jgi:hypothetical protein